MAAISPDLAEKILAADDRNVVKKVSDGGTLSPAQRDGIAAHAAHTLGSEELAKSRVGALLIRWSKGSRLSKEERAEITAHLPVARASPGATSNHYPQTMERYGEIYGVTAKSVKNWVRDGRQQPGEPVWPPLDTPSQMAAWYARVKQRKVPDFLLRFTGPAQAAPGASPATAPGQTSAPPPAATPWAPVPIVEDFGYGLAVAIAAENLQYSQAQLRKARETPDETGRIKQCETSVNAALSEYRKAKNDEHDLLSKQGDMVPRRIMMQKFGVRLASLHQGVRSIPLRAASKLALPPETIRSLIASMNDELDGLFTQLKQDAWQFKERLTLSS